MLLNDRLKTEYQNLFDTMVINSNRVPIVKSIVKKIKANEIRYAAVAEQLNIPWYFAAVIHNMECSLNFSRHLHNGDPLTGRTIHVPAGRPLTGNPPFTWEQSGVDALRLKKLHLWKEWSIPGMLFKLEEYNGFGYRRKHPDVLTPYLWSFSNHYTKGKYIADGKWSDKAVSNQCGAAVILKELSAK
ncbi:MAG: hypothetical protein R6W90_07585 [Ignavibacteriaceae bacterium]